jgi:hypothetical protein
VRAFCGVFAGFTLAHPRPRRIFLFDRIESARAVQPHINAIYFIRPTPDNIKLLCKELNPANQQPSFGQYFIFFSNHLTDEDAQLLAQADQHELVQLVHENWADFLALSSTSADLLVPSLPCLALGSRPEVHHPPPLTPPLTLTPSSRPPRSSSTSWLRCAWL